MKKLLAISVLMVTMFTAKGAQTLATVAPEVTLSVLPASTPVEEESGSSSGCVVHATSEVVEAKPEATTDEAKPEVKSDEVFFVGKKTLEISENGNFEFSDLIGYKTYEDALNKKNGVMIGLSVTRQVKGFNAYRHFVLCTSFVKEEFANESWWINKCRASFFYGVNEIERITCSQLNSMHPFQNSR